MGLFYQQTFNADTKLGIWKIEESESFFLSSVPLERNILHAQKRLQHLAGRFLLSFLFDDFPYELIEIADTRKPFLSNDAYHFSISHCGNFAAAIVSRVSRVGIDIELVKPKIEKISRKFLSETEGLLLFAGIQHQLSQARDPLQETGRSTLLTLCWSAKEAIYKWYGSGSVDFKKHIQLSSIIYQTETRMIGQSYDFSLADAKKLAVNSKIFDDLVLSYLVT